MQQGDASPLIDSRFNILSYDQYLEDMKTKKFNKMCMTQVMNADMTIATHGEEDYYRTASEILNMGNAAYKMMGIDHLIHVYIHSYKTFMAVANDDMSDEDFGTLMKTNHEQYELATGRQTGLGGVSRFVMVFGDDMINRALSAFYVNRKLQNNFIVETDEKARLAVEAEHNQALFELLNYAIDNQLVDMFYQGIYDNRSGRITKYEALMRVYDAEGRVYAPGRFLEAAQRFKLYLTLSRMAVDKALSDFAGKGVDLTLNLSVLDIQSQEFCCWLYERLRAYPEPERITIEFVETENYNNNEQLICSLRTLREIGCKLAIDDFGSGFATYSSIMEVKADVIKVDGTIIRNLPQNPESVIILDSICYMAKLIGSDIVAEFVEDADIQRIVEERGIAFSQGYHFSKPQPFSELGL